METDFFIKNRERLDEQFPKSLVVLTAYDALQRSNDAAHRFEQEANFWYLTGIREPSWRLIIDGATDNAWLVRPEIDDIHAVFEGGLSAEDARKTSGIDQIITSAGAESLLEQLARTHAAVCTLGKHPQRKQFNFHENPAQHRLTKVLKRTFRDVNDCRPQLNKLRAIKQPEEIAALQSAIDLTTDAFRYVKQKLPELHHEYEVEAEFDYYFKRRGADHAYEPIVASGKNACTLHYQANTAPLPNNSLLLLDIGARANGYPADISRTYPIGALTQRHADIHQAVASAHQEIIGLLHPGFALKNYSDAVDDIMKRHLHQLGLLKKTSDDTVYRTYFPHAISHGLGVDVHDSLGGYDTFQAGMVLTVEPGIYTSDEGIGIRLEDDILITSNGSKNLSGALSTALE